MTISDRSFIFTMATPVTEAFLIKDVKPGLKNLNIVFIVLEIGEYLVSSAFFFTLYDNLALFLKGAADNKCADIVQTVVIFIDFFLCTHNGCHTHVSNASSFLSQAELLKRKTAMRCARVKLQIRAGASPFLFGTNPAVSSNQGTSSS